MSEVVQPRVRHDRGHVARLGPEPVERPIGQRFVPDLAREHPFPGSLVGEIIQQRPRRFAEQNVPRPGLGVNQCEPVGLDLAPAQAANLARSASCQQDQPHRRDLDRAVAFEPSQDCAELGNIVSVVR